MRKDGAWGDSSIIQIFSDITGIIVHAVPTEFTSVTKATHYYPETNQMKLQFVSLMVLDISKLLYLKSL